MTKEEIENKYAIEESYKDWESLLKHCIENNLHKTVFLRFPL